MKVLKFRPFKASRLHRLQFFANICRFFFSLRCAGFPRQTLPSISLVPLVFPVVYLSYCFVCCCMFADCVLSFRPGMFCISFRLFFIFYLLVHGFVPPECESRSQGDFQYYILFPRAQLSGLCSQEGPSTWAEKYYDQLVG